MSTLTQEGSESFAGGMVDSIAGTKYQPDEVELILNARVREDATIEPIGGSQKVSASALAGEGYLGYEFQPASGARQWLLIGGDELEISTDQGATSTVEATGLDEGYWDVAEYQVGSTKYLALANGGANVYEWDGTTLTALTEWPAGIAVIEWHNERLWGGGHDGSRLLASKLNDPSLVAVADGGWETHVPLAKGDTVITGLKSKAGQLWVYKRRSITPISGFDDEDFQVGTGAGAISDSDGCVAFRTIIDIPGDGIAWLAEGRMMKWTPAEGLREIGGKLEGFFKRISWADIISNPGMPVAVPLVNTNEVLLAVPAASSRNDYHVLLNLRSGAPSLIRIGTEEGMTIFTDTDGYTRTSPENDRSSVRVEGGYERRARGREAGSFLTTDADGYTRRLSADHDSAVLFVADRGDENSAPVSIGFDGYVRWFDYGDAFDAGIGGAGGTPVVGIVVIRPLLYEKPNHGKQAVDADIGVVTTETVEVVMRMVVDGRSGGDITIPFAAAADEKPTSMTVKPRGYRGKTMQAELEIPRGARLAYFYLRSNVEDRAH